MVIFFFASWISGIITSRFKQIGNNLERTNKLEKDLNNLKDRLDSYKDLAELKYRISLIEKAGEKRMNKRGAIDPRWVIIIIILILLYLFLKQQGLF